MRANGVEDKPRYTICRAFVLSIGLASCGVSPPFEDSDIILLQSKVLRAYRTALVDLGHNSGRTDELTLNAHALPGASSIVSVEHLSLC